MAIVMEFRTSASFERWLGKNHSKSDGIWLRLSKKGGNMIKGSDALDALLCYGWITGQARKGDDETVMWWVCPRRKRSLWSRLNKERAERLIREGKMRPPGLKEIEDAKEDGRWARAYSPQSTARAPADFLKELRKDKDALDFYGKLDRANRYAIIFRLANSRRREEKIASIVRMLKEKRKFH